MLSLILVSSLLLGSTSIVHAINLDIRVRTSFNSPLQSRGDDNIIPVHNTKNAEYIANITLGGREIPVLLDTGSSDLWVTGEVPQTTDLGKYVSLAYAVGTAAGDINTADLEFAGHTVKDQAYLRVANASSFAVDIHAMGFDGLIGLGPNSGSVIQDDLDRKDGSGNSVLSRIFSQNTSSANYMTLLLDRISPANQTFTGQLTIQELVPGFENITNMPKLAVDKVHKLTDADQHWQTYTDVNGIIGPDGEPIKIKSIVPSAPSNQMVVVFDSGYTLPQVPRKMADAIYGRVQGANYDETLGVWTIPCAQELNITFKFGGIEYPVHPLDVSSSDFNVVDATGKTVCVGTFQPITSAFSLLGEYDIILGMAFMRNAYTLLDYGDWLKGSNSKADPYIQLMSVTNRAQAHKDFVNVRLSGVDTTGDTSRALLPADQGKSSPVSSEEKKKMYQEMVLSRWPYIFVGCLVFVIIVIGVIIWRCCVARKRRAARKAAKLGISTKAESQKPYNVVNQNSTVSLHEMSAKPAYNVDDPYGYRGHKYGA